MTLPLFQIHVWYSFLHMSLFDNTSKYNMYLTFLNNFFFYEKTEKQKRKEIKESEKEASWEFWVGWGQSPTQGGSFTIITWGK